MEIKQGYKQTVLGIIPKDWNIKKIGECLSIGHGRDFKSVAHGDIPVYGTGGIISYVEEYLYDGETVCLGRKGTINKPIWHEGKIWTVDTLFYTHSFRNVIPKFLYYLFSNIDWLAYNEATGVPSLTSYRIESIPIVNPPIVEQRAIVKVLSNIDRLIAALERKIAKKRLIKQGAMRQLLTGKKRLPGFTTKWKGIEFGKVVEIYRGGSPRPIEHYLTTSPTGINWIKIGDVAPKDKYINQTEERIIEEGVSRSRKVYVGDFVISNSMSFGRPYILNINGCIHDGWLVIQNYDSTFDRDFLYYLLCSDDVLAQYDSMAAGSSVKNLNKEKVASLSLIVPFDIKEQCAIAQILSNMDKEIVDLEARHDKYRQVKNGMMQKLLTGEIRLVKKPRTIQLEAHVVAGHVVYKLHESKGWGRTKLQKALHLINYHCQIGFAAEFIRNTAGPDDQYMLNCIDAKFRQYRHVDIQQEKCNGRTHYTYKPTAMIQEVESVYNNYPQEIRESIDNLLQVLDELDLGGAEIISTLYAVWNNRIIKQQAITDELLLGDFYAWSEHKADFAENRVQKTLNYMKTINLVPTGWGRYIDKR